MQLNHRWRVPLKGVVAQFLRMKRLSEEVDSYWTGKWIADESQIRRLMACGEIIHMKRRSVMRWCAGGLLGSTMIAQGYCLPEDYWALSGRNAAVALTDALLLQYVFLPIAEGLGIETEDPILDPNANGTVIVQDGGDTGTNGDMTAN